jgi:hypothetical protein
MLAEVLRLLQREGSLLPGEVARRLAMPLEEAEGALAALLAARLVARHELVADCPGRGGFCPSRTGCLLSAGVPAPPATGVVQGSAAGLLP